NQHKEAPAPDLCPDDFRLEVRLAAGFGNTPCRSFKHKLAVEPDRLAERHQLAVEGAEQLPRPPTERRRRQCAIGQQQAAVSRALKNLRGGINRVLKLGTRELEWQGALEVQ